MVKWVEWENPGVVETGLGPLAVHVDRVDPTALNQDSQQEIRAFACVGFAQYEGNMVDVSPAVGSDDTYILEDEKRNWKKIHLNKTTFYHNCEILRVQFEQQTGFHRRNHQQKAYLLPQEL